MEIYSSALLLEGELFENSSPLLPGAVFSPAQEACPTAALPTQYQGPELTPTWAVL